MNSLRLIRYGVLGIPLAFVGLPLYVHVPKLYADLRHVDLERMGIVLLVLRLFDTVLDPVIGMLSDRFIAQRRGIMSACLPLLAGGYFLLFSPPALSPSTALLWLGCCLTVVYLAFSTLMINYYAAGVGMSDSYDDNTRIAAWREGSMLVGVLLASLLPSLLQMHYGLAESYRIFAMVLCPLLFICAFAALPVLPVVGSVIQYNAGESFKALLGRPLVRWALIVALFNAVPTAITSTLFLFFTGDVLQAAKQSGPMLAMYFLSAACAMPVWTLISVKYSKRTGLLIAMMTAIACFIWAWLLGSGDILPFYVICVLSGMTLGADAALLPSLFADVLAGSEGLQAAAFGLWNVTSKLTMALAAGIALPMLAHAGYRPGEHNDMHSLWMLSFCYALLPCMLKAIAVVMLYVSPLDRGREAL